MALSLAAGVATINAGDDDDDGNSITVVPNAGYCWVMKGCVVVVGSSISSSWWLQECWIRGFVITKVG